MKLVDLTKSTVCLLFLSLFSGIAQGDNALPENIHLENSKLAITTNHFYAIKDGRLWYKRNQNSNPYGEPVFWELYGQDGMPRHVETNELFTPSGTLTQVYADGDILAVIGKNNQLFYYGSGTRPFAVDHPYLWRNVWGSPIADHMFVPESVRDITITRRSANTIEYMEDRLGTKIKGGSEGPKNENGKGTYGGLIHMYLLSSDGTEINYADTGLPPGFGYRYASPLRGRFIAESIAGSGSIVFLIGETGRMFSRPLDFDMNGNNPMMYRYSYAEILGEEYTGADVERFGIINLPAIPWFEEPQIEIWGKRAITKEITMISTGKGNAERELRVQGRDEIGRYGYFYKKIFKQTAWTFKETGEQFQESDILVSTDKRQEFKLGKQKDMQFPGSITIKKLFHEIKVNAKVLNFNLTDSPCEILISLPSGEQFEIKLHTVDMWTMQTIDDPGRDGTPKLMMGTIEIPDKVLYSANRNIQAFVQKHLIKTHLAEFRFNLMATKNYLYVESRDANLPIKMMFSNSSRRKPHNPDNINEYLPIINASKYLIEHYPASIRQYYLSDLIKSNQVLLNRLSSQNKKLIEQSKLQDIAEFSGRLIQDMPGFTWLHEWSVFAAPKQLFRWGPGILSARADLLKKLKKDCGQAIEIVKRRIERYQNMQTGF